MYGGMAAANRELLNIPWNVAIVILVYGLAGGLLLGGLASGVMLFSAILKKHKLFIKIALCVFFPITFLLICVGGILSFIPYEIYNFVCIKRNKIMTENEKDSQS